MIIKTAIIRGLSAFSSLALMLVAASLLDNGSFGRFAVEFNLIMFLGVVFKGGADKYIVRSYSSRINILRKHLLSILAGHFFFTVIVAFCLFSVAYWVFNYKIHLAIILSAYFVALLFLISDSIRASQRVNLAIFLQGILAPMTVISLLFLWVSFNLSNQTLVITTSYVITALLGLCFVVYFIGIEIRWINPSFRYGEAVKISIYNISMYGYQALPLVLISWFVSSEEVGVFQYSILHSMCIGMFTLILFSIYEPKFASTKGSSRLLRSVELNLMRNIGAVILFSTLLFVLVLALFKNLLIPEVSVALGIAQVINLLTIRHQIRSLMVSSLNAITVANVVSFLTLTLGIVAYMNFFNDLRFLGVVFIAASVVKFILIRKLGYSSGL